MSAPEIEAEAGGKAGHAHGKSVAQLERLEAKMLRAIHAWERQRAKVVRTGRKLERTLYGHEVGTI